MSIIQNDAVPDKYSLKDLFKDICDAIREKNGKSGLIKHTDIPQEINSIAISGGDDVSYTDEEIREAVATTLLGGKTNGYNKRTIVK